MIWARVLHGKVANWPEIRTRLQAMGIFLAVAIVILGSILFVPGFGSFDNFSAIVRSVSFVGTIAAGMTLVVISGSMVDLSVPAAVAAAAIIAIRLQGLGDPAAVVLAILLPTITLGLVNGFVCGVLRVNPVIGTLATTTIAFGVIIALTHGGEFSYGHSAAFYRFGTRYIIGLPISVWVMFAVFVLMHLIFTRSRFGAYVYATGANYEAARASGVPVQSIVFAAFAITSFLASVSGVLVAAYSNVVAYKVAEGFEFDAVSAVLIGGASLFGGRGSVGRTFAGVILVGVLTNVLILYGASIHVQYIVKGATIIAAVAADIWLRGRTKT